MYRPKAGPNKGQKINIWQLRKDGMPATNVNSKLPGNKVLRSANAGKYYKTTNLIKAGGKVLGLAGVIYSAYDGYENGFKAHHAVDIAAGLFFLTPWGATAGTIYFVADIASKAYNGKSLSENAMEAVGLQ